MSLLKEKRAEFFAKKLSKINGSYTTLSQREKEPLPEKRQAEESVRESAKESRMIKCPKCGKMIDRDRVVKRKYICYECGGYFRVKVPNRIRMVADPHTFEPWFTDMPVSNPLNYEGYEEKLAQAREKTGLDEAVAVGRCKVFGEDIVLGICDARFMMASMGHTVGEKITAAVERAVGADIG